MHEAEQKASGESCTGVLNCSRKLMHCSLCLTMESPEEELNYHVIAVVYVVVLSC